MKHLQLAVLAFAVLSLCGCEGFNLPDVSFDAPFPGKNKKLTDILGEQLTIKTGDHTVTFDIVSTPYTNAIISADGEDTIFEGTVSRYRGRYYLSQRMNDTCYLIHTIKTQDNLVYGLNVFAQVDIMDSLIRDGKHPSLVRSMNEKMVRLHPEKKELRKLFIAVMEGVVPDTIIEMKKTLLATTDSLTNSSFEEEYVSLLKVYPNPASDVLNVELQEAEPVSYQLVDITGKVVQEGQFTATANQVSVNELPAGSYVLVVVDGDMRESVRVAVRR